MGTRSRIGVMHGDNCKSVYCHWDGYLENNGRILAEHYKDPFKLRDLIDIGDLSSLRPEIGVKHAFSQFELPAEEVEAFKALTEEMCTFYGRDRGETGVDAKRFKNFEEYAREHQREEYEYILRRDGKWYVDMYGTDGEFLTLEDAFEFEKENA